MVDTTKDVVDKTQDKIHHTRMEIISPIQVGIIRGMSI